MAIALARERQRQFEECCLNAASRNINMDCGLTLIISLM